MFFRQIEDKGLSQFSYFIACEIDKIALVVDPKRDVDTYMDLAAQHGYKIKYILETHIHADFASGANELANLSGAELMLSSYDTGEKYEYTLKHTELVDQQEILLGKSVKVKVLHTPGHTPEHLSFILFDAVDSFEQPKIFLSGDFLFMGSVGRPDLLGEVEKLALAKKLYHSINTKLQGLHDNVLVYPGHGAGSLCGANLTKGSHSTMGTEREVNVYLKEKMTEDEFLSRIFASTPPFPEYYLLMKETNAKGQALLGGIPSITSLDAAQFENDALSDGVVLDLRHPLSFGGAHIPDALNINMGDELSFWAAWVVPYDMPIYLVVEHEIDLEHAIRSLMRVDLDNIGGYLKSGFNAWVASGADFRDIPQASVLFLDDMMDAGEKLTVLDVRTDSEWKEGHIKGARHIYLGELKDKLDKLPGNDETIFCICGGGHRSSIAASILQAAGFEMVYNVYGGMNSWKAAGLSTVSTN